VAKGAPGSSVNDNICITHVFLYYHYTL
jgi:hypothetical protein